MSLCMFTSLVAGDVNLHPDPTELYHATTFIQKLALTCIRVLRLNNFEKMQALYGTVPCIFLVHLCETWIWVKHQAATN